MDQDWTIRAQGLSKKFGANLRQSMSYGVRDSFRRIFGTGSVSQALRPGEFWAVKDVSFELRRGESLALMGGNGSGKTTLLRILNGIFKPDAGQVGIRGRVGALIAVGAGFAPMLTGRENIHINGSLLGMSKRELSEKLQEIIAFADIGSMIDAPVKHYSSGMVVRLGFAVAAMCEPDVLLIDEILAVGDLNFQRKCYEYLHRLKRNGTSFILVSHSVGAVWSFCERGLLLHDGRVKVAGSVEEVIRAYSDENTRAVAGRFKRDHPGDRGGAPEHPIPSTNGGVMGGTGDVFIRSVTVGALTEQGASDGTMGFGEPLSIEMVVEVLRRVNNPIFRFTIDAVHYKYIACVDSFEQDLRPDHIEPGLYRLQATVRSQNLMPGAYTVNVAVCQKGFDAHLFFWSQAAFFKILHPRDKFLYSEPNAVLYLGGQFSVAKLSGETVQDFRPVHLGTTGTESMR
jgi:lipopolysaccharide transport system ATP-binding protein